MNSRGPPRQNNRTVLTGNRRWLTGNHRWLTTRHYRRLRSRERSLGAMLREDQHLVLDNHHASFVFQWINQLFLFRLLVVCFIFLPLNLVCSIDTMQCYVLEVSNTKSLYGKKGGLHYTLKFKLTSSNHSWNRLFFTFL